MDMKDRQIAVVGVSADHEKYGYRIFRSLRDSGFKVEAINPKLKELEGEKVYPSLEQLPRKPDLVITVVPPRVTEKVVDQAADLGVKELWMQPGSESDEAVRKARERGMNVTFNACFMVRHGMW
jgi:predicted CoA-binding protein